MRIVVVSLRGVAINVYKYVSAKKAIGKGRKIEFVCFFLRCSVYVPVFVQSKHIIDYRVRKCTLASSVMSIF
jgi:hypothetical protein